MTTHDRTAAARLFEGLLGRTHLSAPAEVAGVVVRELQKALGATDVALFVVNREQTDLVPLATPASPPRVAQPVEGSIAGRAFASLRMLTVRAADEDRRRVFVPVVDGTERLGVLEAEVPLDGEPEPSAELMTVLERYGHATAHVLVAEQAYGDTLPLAQRSQPMDIGAELLWSVLPPLTFATTGVVVAAMVEPAYHNGGDAFDYAVNEDVAHFAVFDAVGHGLAAAGLSTFTVAAYRHSRRTGLSLAEAYRAIDEALPADATSGDFVTGRLVELQLAAGTLRWVSAGHPPPLLLRAGRVVKELGSEPATPFGIPVAGGVVVAEERLEPGDQLVLCTDGVTEARRPDGGLLGVDGLVGFLQREAADQRTPPETLRRLRHALLAADTRLRDDATVLLVDWHSGSERALLPQTVLGA